MKESYQKLLVAAVGVLVVATVAFGLMAISRLERITQVAERTEAKLDKILEAAAPVGRAAVEKGVDAVNNIDAEDLGRSTTKGIKDIGAAAKSRLIEELEKRQEAK